MAKPLINLGPDLDHISLPLSLLLLSQGIEVYLLLLGKQMPMACQVLKAYMVMRPTVFKVWNVLLENNYLIP